jgi:hypothetical protein
VSRSAAWRILTRRSNDIGDSPKAAENRAMKAERPRPTACDRLWTLRGTDGREAISAKARAIGGSLKIEKRSTHPFVETRLRRSNASRRTLSGVIYAKSRFGMRQTSDKYPHHNLACLLHAVFRQER